MSNRRAITALICVAVFTAAAFPLSHEPTLATDAKSANIAPSYAHGTINVVLANGNGAVVETDSRLSLNGRSVGKGQKLYKLDERTVCAIAGFFTLPLPVFEGSYSPTPSSVPAMIEQYLKERNGQLGDTLSEKMDSLVEIFSFDMAFTSSVAISHLRFNPSSSALTLVGYEAGQLKILQAHLKPSINPNNGYVTYEATVDPQIIVGKELKKATAGLDFEVTKVLSSAEARPNDHIVHDYQVSMSETQGQSMQLEDLRILANEMVRTAERFHPGEVGDERQTAILTGGKISHFEQTIEPLAPGNLQLAGINEDATDDGSLWAFVVATEPHTFTTPRLFVHARINGMNTPCTFQQLDNIIFTGSAFTDTCLLYQGSPLTIFDKSNVLTRSTLRITANTENSPFVKRFRRDFPNVPIAGGKPNTSEYPARYIPLKDR
jgi:hypothetical protein